MKKPFILLIICCISIWLPAHAQTELSPNLIRNSFMNVLDGDKPSGYISDGNIIIQAVHPFTKGFEGPYLQVAPANASSSVDAATEQNPYFFGVWNMGLRSINGGLSGGWHGYPDGKILKITGNNSGANSTVYFPFEENAQANTWRFRAWIKIVSADTVGFGNDAGYLNGWYGSWGTYAVTKQQTDQSTDGWFYIDQVIPSRKISRLQDFSFSMGIKGANIEVYLALPYLTAVTNYQAWLPSVADMLNRDGVSIHPSTGNVGIGTADTKGYKLAVNGSAVFTQAVVKNYTSWPDYVFDSSYSLRDLTSIETFIKANKHLPDIPSATAIQENGIDLGHMQAKLLQKVEELTLYLIDLKKENQEIKVQNGLVLKQNQLLQAQIEELKKNTK